MRFAILPCLALMACLGGATSLRADDKKPASEENRPFDDAHFVMMAASGGMHEVELGKLAASAAKMDDVKKFGERMVTDHSKANAELMKVAKANKMAIPEKMSEKHQKEADHFKDLKGEEFDKAYIKHMVHDHEMDVAEFTRASKEAKNPELRDFATKTLPTLKEHLKMAKELSEKVK